MKRRVLCVMAGALSASVLFSACGPFKKSDPIPTPTPEPVEEIAVATVTPTPIVHEISIKDIVGVYKDEASSNYTLQVEQLTDQAVDINISTEDTNGDLLKWSMIGILDPTTLSINYEDAVKTRKTKGSVEDLPETAPTTGTLNLRGTRLVWVEGEATDNVVDSTSQMSSTDSLATTPEPVATSNANEMTFVYSMSINDYELQKSTVTPTPEPETEATSAESSTSSSTSEASEESEGDIYYVAADELYVRTDHSVDADIVGAVYEGEEVIVLEHIDDPELTYGWYSIKYGSEEQAYVSAEFITKDKPAVEVSADSTDEVVEDEATYESQDTINSVG